MADIYPTIITSPTFANLDPKTEVVYGEQTYSVGETAFADLRDATEAAAEAQGSIEVLAGSYGSALSNITNQTGVTFSALNTSYGELDTTSIKAKTFTNNGIFNLADSTITVATFVNTDKVTLEADAIFTATNVTNSGTFSVTDSKVNATFSGNGKIELNGTLTDAKILGTNRLVAATVTTLDGTTAIEGTDLAVNNNIVLKGTASLVITGTATALANKYVLIQGNNQVVLPTLGSTAVFVAVNAEGAILHDSTVGGTVSFGKNTNLLGANTIGSINLQGKAIDDPSGNYKKLTIGNGSDATSLTTKMIKLGVSSANTKGYLDINNATVTITDNAGTTPNGQLLVAKGSLVNIMGGSKVNVDIVHLPSQINVDVLSTITVTDAIYGYGSGIINVDTTAITGTTEKLYTVVKGDLDNVNLYIDGELFDGNPVKGYNVTTIGDQGVFLTTESQSNLFVSSEYSDDKIGTLVNGHLVGYNAFSNLADAAKAAPVGTASTITVSGTDEIVAASAFGGGQDVTITGEATFNWGKGWLFVGRDAAQGDVTQLAKVTFKDATIGRTTSSPSDCSINISGAKKDSTSTGYGQVDFDNSTVTTEWIINKNMLTVENGSVLTAVQYLNVAGRPADETFSGEDDTAKLIIDNSTVNAKGNSNSSGLTIGNEGKGEVDLTNNATLNAKSITATAKSEINVTNSTVSVDEKFSNAGTVNVTGVSKISAAEYTGDLTLGKLGETTTVITTDGLKATSGNVLIADGGTVAMNGNGFDLKYVRDSKVRDNDEEHVGYTLNIGNADLFKAYALYINGDSVINVDNVKDIESWYFNIYGGTLNLNGTDKAAFTAGVVDNGNITGSLNVTKTTLDLATLNVLAAPAEKHAGEVKATGAEIDVRFTNIGTKIVEDKKYAAGTSQTASLELDGSTLIVKNIAGEPTLGSITVGGDEATAGTLTMKNGSAVVQKFTDSEASHYRSAQFVVGKNGLVDIDKSSVTMDIVNNAGTIDVAGEGVIAAKTLTNSGTINVGVADDKETTDKDESSVGTLTATSITNSGMINVNGDNNTFSAELSGGGTLVFRDANLDNKITLSGTQGEVSFLGTGSIVDPVLTVNATFYVGAYVNDVPPDPVPEDWNPPASEDSNLTISGDVIFAGGATYVGADYIGSTGNKATLTISEGKTLTVSSLYTRYGSAEVKVEKGAKLLSGYGNLQGALTVDGGFAQFSSVAASKYGNSLKSATNGGVLDLGYIEGQDATKYPHRYSVTNNSVLTVGNLYNTGVAISMDTSSTLALAPQASQLAAGTKLAITIDTSDYEGGIVKLIDMNAKYNYETKEYTTAGYNVTMTVDDYKRIVTNWDKNFKVIDNDLYISDISADTVYVNTDWTSTSVLPEGKSYGINAFSSMQDATVAANANGGSEIVIEAIKVPGEAGGDSGNVYTAFDAAGTYKVVGGNIADKAPMSLFLNGEGVTLNIGDATAPVTVYTAGKIRGGKDSSGYKHNTLNINNAIIGAKSFEGAGGGWETFYDTSISVSNSIWGAKLDAPYYENVTTMPRGAADTKAAVAAGTLNYVGYGSSINGQNFGTLRDVTITDSTMATGFFDVRGRGLITLNNSLVYVGGSMSAGSGIGGGNWTWGNNYTPVEDYREGEVATITVGNGSIIRNVGYGNGNEGKGIQIGTSGVAGAINVTDGSQVLMAVDGFDKESEDIKITLGSLNITDNSEVTGRNITNAGTINLGNEAVAAVEAVEAVGEPGAPDYVPAVEAVEGKAASAGNLTATTLSNTGTINAYAGSTITTTGLFTNDNEVVLVGTALTTNGIVNNASFKATDSVIDGGGQGGSPHITNGLGGTMELTNSSITTGAFIINSYGTSISLDNSTLDARIINSREITAVDSTIISTDLRNEGGKFVVSGDSTLNVKLTNGTIDLENATLTATTVTGAGNLSIAAQYVVTPAVPAQGVEGEEGYVAGSDAVLGDNIVTFNGANTVNAITNVGTLKIQTIPAVEAQGVEGEEGYVAGSDAVAGALTAGAITNFITVGEGADAVTTSGTITIDATSTLTATSIAGGTIELTNFADNATRPVITVNSTDFTADVVWTYDGKDYTLDGATTYTDDNKFLVQKTYSEGKTTISVVNVSSGLETLVVNSDWSTKSAGDVVTVGEKDYIIGYNAFANVDGVFALYGDKDHRNTVTKEVVFLSDSTASVSGSKTFFFSDVDIAFTAESDVTVDLAKYGRVYLMGYYTIDNWTVNLPKDDEGNVKLPTFTVGKGVTIVTSNALASGQSIDQDDVDAEGTATRPAGASNIVVNGTLACQQIQSVPYSSITTSTTGVLTLMPGKNSGSEMVVRSNSQIVVNGDGEFEDAQFTAGTVTVQGGTLSLINALGKLANGNGGLSLNNRASDLHNGDTYIYATNAKVELDNSKLYLGKTGKLQLGTHGSYPSRTTDLTLNLTNGSVLAKYDGDTYDLGVVTENIGKIFIESNSKLIGATVKNFKEDGEITVTTGGSLSATALTNEGTITIGGADVAAVGTEGEPDYKPAVAGAGSLTADTITNSGSIDVTNGSTLTATGIITNNGEFSATGSTILAKATGFGFVNSGTLTIDSSTVTVGGGAAILKNEGSGAKQITIQNDSTVNAGLYNYTGATVTIIESTVGTAGAYVKNWGTIEATDAVLKASYVENYGTYTVGGESSFAIGSLSVGSITLADDAEISASTITESAEGTSVKVLADTEVTFVGTNSINAVIDNAGSLSADDLQVKKLINGIAATESTESVKGTITAATLTAGSIENNNGAGTNSGSSIELTGELIAGDIKNGVEAIADEAANNAEPGNKAFITAANITAGSITNYGTVGSQAEGKELATITLTASDTATGKLTNGKYGNVFATTLTADSIENDGEIVVNEIYAGSINNKASGENKPCGVIAVDTGSIDIEAGEIINSGYIKTNGGSITAGAITNNAYNADTNDGLIWTDSIIANGTDGTVINYGKIDVDGTLTANRVENKGGEFTVNGESVIVGTGADGKGNVVVSGGKVTFNGDVTAANLNTQNASATININGAKVTVAGTIYYSGTIVAEDSDLDGSKFSGTGTLKVVNSSIDGITLNHGTMQLDDMSLANVTIDGAFDVVGDSDFSGVNVVEGLTVSEGANLTISASATITSLTQPALTVTAGDLVNNGAITIDASGLEWGSTLKQLKVVSVTGADRKVINSGTITVENADNTMAIVQDDGIYLYYVKSSGDTKTLFVNEAWNYAPGYEWDYDAEHHLVFGVNAFQNANDIVFYTNTEALVFVGGNTTPYADLLWNKDDVSVTIDGGLTANFSDITLGAATLTGNITANEVTFTGDAVLNGTADVAALNIEKTLAMDWINPIEADTLNAAPASITIDLSHDLETVGAYKTVIATNDWSVAQFESAVADYDKNADIFKVEDGDLKLDAAAIGKVFSSAAGKTGIGYFTTVADAVSDVATKRILIDSNDLVDGKVENVYLRSKRGVVLSSAGQISRSVFSGGYDVSTLTGVKYRPFSDNYKHVGEEGAKESTNVTINGGTYNGYVIGADMILLDTEKETNVLFYRTGDSNLTINAGDFKASANGVRAIAGGMMYAISGSGKTGRAGLVGDVNLTITGGTFYGFNVYGGNYANNNKNYGTFTSIEGDITVTLDATVNKLVFGENNQSTGIITAGSYGPSSVDGSTKIVLTGDQGIEFQQLIGGCSGDIYSKDTKTDKWVNESMVTGSRTLSFTGFSGDLDFAKIHGFNTVSFEGANEINFDGEFHRYFNDEVTNWNFAADSEVTGSLSFDFLGDALNLDDFTTGGWELSNVSMDAATTVSFDGELATGNIEDGWTNAAGTLALSFDSEANKLSLASINIG